MVALCFGVNPSFVTHTTNKMGVSASLPMLNQMPTHSFVVMLGLIPLFKLECCAFDDFDRFISLASVMYVASDL